MPGTNTRNPQNNRVAGGDLKDGWTYEIERIPKSDRFRATVLHPYGDAPFGGMPWPIEDPTMESDQADPAHPTFPSIERAVSAAESYVDLLSKVPGYPDPDKMSARGFRPTIW